LITEYLKKFPIFSLHCVYGIRQRFSAEEKIRIVLEGFRKEILVSDLCGREGISLALYYPWLKDFTEAGRARNGRRDGVFIKCDHRKIDGRRRSKENS
jgi:transposase-like protein